MRVLHVTHSYWPATFFGGPIYSTLGLCEALARMSAIELRVLSTDAAGPSAGDRQLVTAVPMRYPPGYDVYFARQTARNFAPRQIPAIWKHAQWADYILLTGTYSFHVVPTLLFARLLRKPVVWSPRGGLLDSHRWVGHRHPVAKRLYERVCRWVVGPNACFVVTSGDEATASRARVGDLPTFVVPNGVDMPSDPIARDWRPGGRLRLMSMGRLDRKKGLENLITAMTLLGKEVSLGIYGQGEPSYETSLRHLAAQLGVEDRVSFNGHVEGAGKVRAFARSDLFVLPSHSENFAMVVAEALSHGVPAVVSHGAPWEQINVRGAGLWVANDPVSLSEAITSLQKKDLRAMGMLGRTWMKRDFGWDARASDLVAVFDVALSRSGPWAHFDATKHDREGRGDKGEATK